MIQEGYDIMSDREKATALLERIPDYQIKIIIAYLQGVLDASGDIPNDDTISAIEELETGGGEHFSGSTADLFAKLMEDE